MLSVCVGSLHRLPVHTPPPLVYTQAPSPFSASSVYICLDAPPPTILCAVKRLRGMLFEQLALAEASDPNAPSRPMRVQRGVYRFDFSTRACRFESGDRAMYFERMSI
jgi:hypothetical protein